MNKNLKINIKNEIANNIKTVRLVLETEHEEGVIEDVFYEGTIPAKTLELYDEHITETMTSGMTADFEALQGNMLANMMMDELKPDSAFTRQIVQSLKCKDSQFKPKQLTKYILDSCKEDDIEITADILKRIEDKIYAVFYSELKQVITATKEDDTPSEGEGK